MNEEKNNDWNESSTNSFRECFRFVFDFATIEAEFVRNSVPTSAISWELNKRKQSCYLNKMNKTPKKITFLLDLRFSLHMS